ncbi:MAG: hypothetical protein QM777_06595 [Pseudorhodoferax sp.]
MTVVEGRVAVGSAALPGGERSFVQLGADQQIVLSEDAWPAVAGPVDAHSATAWLHRQIQFEREPLEQVASEFNRYAAKPIQITSPGLRALKISGIFATDDTDAFVAFLRSLEGVHVEVTATEILVSQD